MRTARVGARDVTATLIVAAAAVMYGLDRSGVQLAGLGSTRALAAVVLALGLVACALGARNDAFAGERGVPATPPITRVLSVLGGGAFFVGIAAIVTASDAMLTALIVLALALWLLATVRHLAMPLPAKPTSHDGPLAHDRPDRPSRIHVGGEQR